MIFRIVFALFLIICSHPTHASDSVFRVWSGPLANYVPTDQYNKPLWSWSSKNTLLVHVIVNSTSSSVVDETSGSVTVKGKNIVLCYRMRQVNYPKNQPALSAAFPEVMEFLIPNLSPLVKYNFVVKKDCVTGSKQ